MTDSEEEVIEAILHVAENDPVPADGGVKVPVGSVASRLCEQHGYVDEEGSGLTGTMVAAFEQYNGKLWTYTRTDQDGLPAHAVFVPDAALDDMKDVRESSSPLLPPNQMPSHD